MTYLDLLRAELAEYERKRAKAETMLTGDDDYKRLVLAGWDHAIGVKRAQIEREEREGVGARAARWAVEGAPRGSRCLVGDLIQSQDVTRSTF